MDGLIHQVVPKRRNEETGEFSEVYDNSRICEVLKGTRLSTSEVADKLGCHRTTAHTKLTEMEEDGLATSTQAGNTLIWELTE